jgi:peptidoglycan L-alanyl-D-glutamate endopeptidase CwlK
MAFQLSKASRAKLTGVHPDLVKVVTRAIELTPVDFRVLEGLRSAARQKKLKAVGASTILNSRHITGHAIDFAALVDGKVDWSWPLYGRIAAAFKRAAKEMGVPITWGGDWKSFKDGGHIELPRRNYPA